MTQDVGLVAKIMDWATDEQTSQAATAYPLLIKRNVPAPQFADCNKDLE